MSRIKVVPSACTVIPALVPEQSGVGAEPFFFIRDIVSMMTTGRFNADLKISLMLIVLTLLVFARAGGLEFLSYDDNLYVTDNQTVQGGLSWSNAAWAFTTMHAANWHPLTWLSLMLDIQLFGPRPGALHLVNVLFHAVNTVLLFLLLARMTGAKWRSAFVAALFAIHPLHVESVAWVAERKDVLSVLFGLYDHLGLYTLCSASRTVTLRMGGSLPCPQPPEQTDARDHAVPASASGLLAARTHGWQPSARSWNRFRSHSRHHGPGCSRRRSRFLSSVLHRAP